VTDRTVEKIAEIIRNFDWSEYGLDELEGAEPEYATYLAKEIMEALSAPANKEFWTTGTVIVVAGKQVRAVGDLREGICGDESSTHSINCSGTMRAICTLGYGHMSDWHADDFGHQWKKGNKT
jgi:hypothetical protein